MRHSHGGCAQARRHAGCRAPTAFRTATAAINRGKPRHAAALSEFIAVILNGLQRSVNRKVQGSNPWSGAKSEYENRNAVNPGLTAVVREPDSNRRPPSEPRAVQGNNKAAGKWYLSPLGRARHEFTEIA